MREKPSHIIHLPVAVCPTDNMYMYVELTLHVFIQKFLQNAAFRSQILILNLNPVVAEHLLTYTLSKSGASHALCLVTFLAGSTFCHVVTIYVVIGVFRAESTVTNAREIRSAWTSWNCIDDFN